ncbi:MAG: SH3 domain-containing protein [Cyanobacteria bacterium J06632_22]
MAVKQFAVGFSKFVIGVFLALAVIGLAGVATTKYFLTRLTHLPERPVYNNDSPAQPTAANADAFTAPADAPPTETAPQPAPTTAAPTPEEEAPTEEGLYDATVVQAIGLLVRSGPGPEHGQLGGVDFQDQLTVLEESNGWLRIRSENGIEGWVKGGGNVQRSN